jgi:hypothetical protein
LSCDGKRRTGCGSTPQSSGRCCLALAGLPACESKSWPAALCASGGARRGDETRWRRQLYRGERVPLAWCARLGRRRRRR